jgi:hypothetical protein
MFCPRRKRRDREETEGRSCHRWPCGQGTARRRSKQSAGRPRVVGIARERTHRGRASHPDRAREPGQRGASWACKSSPPRTPWAVAAQRVDSEVQPLRRAAVAAHRPACHPGCSPNVDQGRGRMRTSGRVDAARSLPWNPLRARPREHHGWRRTMDFHYQREYDPAVSSRRRAHDDRTRERNRRIYRFGIAGIITSLNPAANPLSVPAFAKLIGAPSSPDCHRVVARPATLLWTHGSCASSIGFGYATRLEFP